MCESRGLFDLLPPGTYVLLKASGSVPCSIHCGNYVTSAATFEAAVAGMVELLMREQGRWP